MSAEPRPSFATDLAGHERDPAAAVASAMPELGTGSADALGRVGLRGAWVAVGVVLILTSAFAAILAWRADKVEREWLVGAALGTFLLAVAGAFDAVLLARSRRPLDIANRALRVAAADLAASYAALAEAHRELGVTAEARDRALQDLRAAVREREAFLASVSHDLKTPLTLIKGHADLLHGRALATDLPEVRRMAAGLGSIGESATEMAGLIEDLLDLARLEMGQTPELTRRPTDLVGLVRRVVGPHQSATDRHRFRLDIAVPELVGTWDPTLLERVLDNLLTNAVKYSPEGGEIGVALVRVDDGGGATAVLTVRDEGMGIPAADLPRVFERFFRAENVAGQIDGTGLGLAGVRYTVESHGGTIGVVSREGAGSTFTIRLPLDAPEPAKQATATIHASPSGGRAGRATKRP